MGGWGLTCAFAARRFSLAAMENRSHALSSSDIAASAKCEQGPRVTMTPNTTCARVSIREETKDPGAAGTYRGGKGIRPGAPEA